MKYKRKCPCCGKKATRRIGKLDFCDNCAKEIHKCKAKYVWNARYVYSLDGKLKVYRDYLIPIY